jgi:hypothetical protein
MKRIKVLLVEPKSRNSYPPLGLMKISTYHKLRGDLVQYVYGCDGGANAQFWDCIYITSLFTWDFNELVKTIKFYSNNLFNFKNIKVGGVSATLLRDEVEALTGITPVSGALNSEDNFLAEFATAEPWANYLLQSKPCIDYLPPDYSIAEYNPKYKKLTDSAYMMYSTKGCPNDCSFCAVKILEPDFVNYIPIYPRIKYLAEKFGEKHGILFLDNNIAASKEFDRMVDELKDCGFGTGAKLNKKSRFVDYNQGVDARRLTPYIIKRLAELCIDPLRIAYDDVAMTKMYTKKVLLSIDNGINKLSNYMLYNHKDKPVDLYKRLKVNIDINADTGAKIFSFPMKFIPLHAKDRSFVSEYWSRRQLRAIQIITNVTKGIVSGRSDFFYHAFGHDEEEYHRILLMPQNFIFHRVKHENDGSIASWNEDYSKLNQQQKEKLFDIIKEGRLAAIPYTNTPKINKMLEYYASESTKTEAVEVEANE